MSSNESLEKNNHIKYLISEGKICDVVNFIALSEPFEINYEFFKVPNPVPIVIAYLEKKKEDSGKILEYSKKNGLRHLEMFLLVLG